jgi:hypothetical protein
MNKKMGKGEEEIYGLALQAIYIFPLLPFPFFCSSARITTFE